MPYNITLAASKKAVTRHWLSPHTNHPGLDQYNQQHKRIPATICLKPEPFVKTWTKWTSYMDK